MAKIMISDRTLVASLYSSQTSEGIFNVSNKSHVEPPQNYLPFSCRSTYTGKLEGTNKKSILLHFPTKL